MDLALGVGFIVLPVHHQLPLALATALFKGLQGLRQRRKLRRAASSAGMLGGAAASQEVLLEWRDVTCALKQAGAERLLLRGVSGSAAPGRLTAIMGPSGSGKTTLLGALTGQMRYSPSVRLTGAVAANGAPLGASRLRIGFVQQEDLFFPQLTVRETLLMAAELRLGRAVGAEQRGAAVDAVIAQLGLAKSANTPVGDAKTRGLSGGERKRLSIAIELIARPALLALDEPTSGLDAFGAQQVVEALKALCGDGHTVLCSIHQPRSSVWALLDDLVLLAGGRRAGGRRAAGRVNRSALRGAGRAQRLPAPCVPPRHGCDSRCPCEAAEGEVVYCGPADGALPWFARLGHSCPEHFNPAEWLADLVALDHSSPEAEAASRARVRRLADAWRDAPAVAQAERSAAAPATAAPAALATAPRPGCGLRRTAALLFGRSLRQVLRDRAVLAGRASSQLSSAAVFAAVYWRLRRDQPGVQGRLGLLQVSAVGTAMSSLIKTLNVFPRERLLVGRERARSGYGVLPYLLAKLAAELPVGAVFPALFGCLVYPAAGLNPRPARFAAFLGVLTLEAMSAQGLGLAVGAAAPSTEAALAIGPAVILVSIVFGGLFTNPDAVPRPLRWLPATSLIKQAFEGACVNEFRGAAFELDERGHGAATGEEVLERLSFGGSSLRRTMANQGRIMLCYWWLCYRTLVRGAPRYQPMLPA